ncbi:MAG TPA: hypothetical protein PLY31_10755, partial [Tenuifilaceae bacterium]|nr:hypothetical protein [Tenuifilaceae bacterium]
VPLGHSRATFRPRPICGSCFYAVLLIPATFNVSRLYEHRGEYLSPLGLKSKGKKERIQGLSKKTQNPNAHYQLARNQLKNFNKTPIELMRQILTNFLSAFISYLKGGLRLAFEIL